jgi:hypothetical protein
MMLFCVSLKNNIMQTRTMGRAALTVAIVSLCAGLFSFNSPRGGDSVEVYLNNKLVFKQHMYGDKKIGEISLDQANYSDELKVVYSECGRIGQGRRITVKDHQNKTVKELNFADGSSTPKGMIFKVKDLLDLKKGKMNLYYTSRELTKEQLIAAVKTQYNSLAKN